MVEQVAAQLAPFIAWLAGREPDAGLRRRYHAHVEAYLRDVVARERAADPAARRRYEASLTVPAARRAEIRVALDRFAEHHRSARLAAAGRTASVSGGRPSGQPAP